MQGLALARSYYEAHIDRLMMPYPAWRHRVAAGLVGQGSECFGYDDAASQDHDFGPGFCLWLDEADYQHIGPALQSAYDALPPAHAGYPGRQSGARTGKRVGVFSIAGFYTQFLGAPELPISDADWLQIPEEYLATAVNGAVFTDPLGQFSQIRQHLLAYYPEPVRRRKLAQAAAKMAQAGQYNLPRALARGEGVTALLAQAEFIRHTCLMAHALNRRYAPFYKWQHRSLRDLPVLGADLHARLALLSQTPAMAAQPLIEGICEQMLQALVSQGLTQPGEAFLEAHVDRILGRPAHSL